MILHENFLILDEGAAGGTIPDGNSPENDQERNEGQPEGEVNEFDQQFNTIISTTQLIKKDLERVRELLSEEFSNNLITTFLSRATDILKLISANAEKCKNIKTDGFYRLILLKEDIDSFDGLLDGFVDCLSNIVFAVDDELTTSLRKEAAALVEADGEEQSGSKSRGEAIVSITNEINKFQILCFQESIKIRTQLSYVDTHIKQRAVLNDGELSLLRLTLGSKKL